MKPAIEFMFYGKTPDRLWLVKLLSEGIALV
jgi:hypothetical protein